MHIGAGAAKKTTGRSREQTAPREYRICWVYAVLTFPQVQGMVTRSSARVASRDAVAWAVHMHHIFFVNGGSFLILWACAPHMLQMYH
jgi:hypothetical protein